MRIAVIGTGYVGLVAGACFAETGNDVICVDSNPSVVASLRDGKVHIYEPGLEAMVARNVEIGRLGFTTDTGEAVRDAEVVFIAVGTPEGASGEADLSMVLEAARQIGLSLRPGAVVVDKSTVPVGTADRVRETIAAVTDVPFEVVSNPEFLKEGAAIEDFLRPDRVVIGGRTEAAREKVAELYRAFMRSTDRIVFMDERSAELTKYAANAMLATRISFMNDIATLAEKVGADVESVRRGIGSDSRIGVPFLYAGVGYGGSCFPKDVKALVTTARTLGLELDLLRAVERTNERQKRWALGKALSHFGSLEGRRFAVWGLAFKPRTDDMREAPSIDLVEGLLGKGATVAAYDPVATTTARRVFGSRVTMAARPMDALEGADGLFVMTEWSEFRHPDFARIKSTLREPVIFDGRNVYDPVRMRAEGITYFGVGRPAA